jgi:two-component system chemotaxis response regulator CheY
MNPFSDCGRMTSPRQESDRAPENDTTAVSCCWIDVLAPITMKKVKTHYMAKKYLIVDDDEPLRDLLYTFFCDDADILTAQNGQEALALVKVHCFDIILTDYNMPVMNGIEFLERAREINSDTYLHSILLTGCSDKEVKSFSERNSVTLILKPFSVRKLEKIVNMLLEESAGNHPSYPMYIQGPGKGGL